MFINVRFLLYLIENFNPVCEVAYKISPKIKSICLRIIFLLISQPDLNGTRISRPRSYREATPPLLATVFSRSSYGWAGVSLNVTEILIFDFQGSWNNM